MAKTTTTSIEATRVTRGVAPLTWNRGTTRPFAARGMGAGSRDFPYCTPEKGCNHFSGRRLVKLAISAGNRGTGPRRKDGLLWRELGSAQRHDEVCEEAQAQP